MGDCRYCGKSAGFLRKEHQECAAAHAQGLDSIGNVCVEAALHGVEVNQLPSKVRAIGAAAYIDTSEAAMAATLARGWGQALKAAMDDHFLSSEEKRALNRYRAHYNLSAAHLDGSGHFTLFRMMNLLNALSEHGLVPRFDRRAVRPPFNLMKSEELLWLFGGTDYFEQITRREFRGGSLGRQLPGGERRLHPARRVPRPLGRIEFDAAYRLGHAGHHDQAYLFQREQQEFPGQAGEDRLLRSVRGWAGHHARHGESQAGDIQDGRDRCLVSAQHHRRGDGNGQCHAAEGGRADAGRYCGWGSGLRV